LNSPLPEVILFEAKGNSDDNSGECKEGLNPAKRLKCCLNNTLMGRGEIHSQAIPEAALLFDYRSPGLHVIMHKRCPELLLATDPE
jgi:hypothetical protein